MSLHFDLCVNHKLITSFVATRRTGVDSRPQPDDVNTYHVDIINNPDAACYYTDVEHRYGDGALALVHKALGQLLAEQNK